MWTSEPDRKPIPSAFARRFLEAAGLAAVFALAPELLRARLAVVVVPPPGGFAVVVLAARYGLGGLLSGVLAVAGAVALGAAIAGTPLLAAWALFHTTPDLFAFAACMSVAWVAAWHVRREAELDETAAML